MILSHLAKKKNAMRIESSDAIDERVLAYKRYIHDHPEPGWQEIGTTTYIKEQLDVASIIDGLGDNRTGAAFVIGKGDANIFVRADIDALKTSDGPKHVCRHSRLNATGKSVTFIFQPAEEVHPSGARTLLDTHPHLVDRSSYGFGIHVEPRLPMQTVQIQGGNIWAANDPLRIEIHGFTAHIKDTPKGIDAIEGAAQVVQRVRAFQREFDNFGSEIVFNLNTIHGGVANNSIADSVVLTGSIRWIHRRDQQRVKQFLEILPDEIKDSFSGSVSVTHIEEKPPACHNDPTLADEVADYMVKHSDLEVRRSGLVSLAVEDFAWYSQQQKTLYSLVGVDCPYDLHDPRMVVSDEATLSVYSYWQHLLEWWITSDQ